MINFLHTFNPTSTLISFGPIHIYWYGLCIVLGAIAGIAVILNLTPKYGLSKDAMLDLALYLMIAGIIGARIYDVLLELDFYRGHPLDVFKIWQGGMAIHGAIIAGFLTIWLFAKKSKINFWLITDIVAAGTAIGQAFGRWGNYFNQELFGRPTNLPWGIPITPLNRPFDYASFGYFHPTFLYESLGNFIIFAILFCIHMWNLKDTKADTDKRRKIEPGKITAIYLILYSILRFSLEFVRIDRAPVFLGLRVPQLASIVLVIAAIAIIFRQNLANLLKKNNNHANINDSSH